MPPFIIVPVDDLHTELRIGNHDNHQVAFTDLGEKPAGDDWEPVPAVRFNPHDGTYQLIWRRPLAVDIHDDDTQAVPVDAFAQQK